MLKVAVSSSGSDQATSFDINSEQGKYVINGLPFNGDIAVISENRYHIIWQNKSYNVEILERDASSKTFRLLINGVEINSSTKDELDILLAGMGFENNVDTKINNAIAPMPGLIQSVAVKVGDKVEKGDTLLVLVAMKMENIIKSTGSGEVKSINASAGEIVEKNQVLMEFI